MDTLTLCILLVAVCFAVVVITGALEILLKKKKEAKTVQVNTEPAEPKPEFTAGRIYQMEDGSFAKYAGNGKFLKVRK